MSLSVAAWLTTSVFAGVLATACARRHDQRPARSLALVLMACLAALPFAWPASTLVARVLTCGFAIALSMKLWRAFTGRGPRDPHAQVSAFRYCAWLLVPPETAWPRDAAAAGRNRRAGAGRLGRAACKAAIVVITAAAANRAPAFAEALRPLEFYAFLTGAADVVTGVVMLAGVHVDEAFVRPFAARSPADFWARRWNLPVSSFLRTYVFAPMARRWHPVVGVTAAFAASALMHEYLVAALVGVENARFGYMTGFFTLQGLAVYAQRWATEARAWPVLTAVWMVATSPLFFAPLTPVMGAFDAAVLAPFLAPFRG